MPYDLTSVQLLSHVRLFETPWTAARQASLSLTNSWSLHKLMSTELVMPSNHLILCRLLLLPPSIFPSIRVFSSESGLCIRWPKYWSFSFSLRPSLPLINIQDWFPLGLTGFISLRSKGFPRVFSNITVQKHQFFSTQPSLWSNSDICMTSGKTIALTIWTFAGKLIALLFNMLSRIVIVFLPRSKCLPISWLQSPSTMILEPKGIKICHCFHFFHFYLPWSDGTRCHDLNFLNAEF